jgi:hypothetical protein
VGGTLLESLQVLGFDEQTGRYRLHLFDNGGYARVYEGTFQDGVWSLAGAHERVEIHFESDDAVMRMHWEQSQDGRTWETLCRLRSVRLHDVANPHPGTQAEASSPLPG